LVRRRGIPQLAGSDKKSQTLRRVALSPTSIAAAIALVVILAAGFFADYQNRLVYDQRHRADVLAKLGLVRARLEGNIFGNIQLVRGFVAVLSTEPDMDASRFETLAGATLRAESQLRHLALAPDMVVSMIYPLAGNEAALGADYRFIDAQREATFRARDTGEMVLAGPVDLVQGGRGLIGRFPVFVDAADGTRRFWGIVSAVIDLDRLYEDSGLLAAEQQLDIAIRGEDGLGERGGQIFGPRAVFADDPVVEQVLLPSGSWQIAAVPKGGWELTPENSWLLRALVLAAGIAVIGPILIAGRLIDERHLHLIALRSRESELKRLSRRLGLALDTSQVGVWEYNIVSGELVWDDRMNELYGAPVDGGRRDYGHWRNALHPEDRERAEQDFARAITTRGRYQSEFRVRLRDGTQRYIRAIGGVFDDDSEQSKILGVNWDVSADVALNEDLKRTKSLTEARNAELEAAKARIEHNALHDSLTGLPNRRYLDEMLVREAERCRADNESLALLHIDLDRFKQINDTLGHAAGDAMLIHASKVLLGNVRRSDFVARIGGDEFVVLCGLEGGPERLAGLADRIIAQMRLPVAYQGHECRFGVSVGIASETTGAVDPRRLLVNADIALYRAKRRGRNRYEFFTDALQAEVINTKRIADDILSGLERHEFVPFFQPQFDARSLDVVGVEALARWKHPTDGLLAPSVFIGVAEELSVVSMIDRMILEQALSHFAAWREAGLKVPKVSVNVSARRLQDEALISGLRGLDIAPGTVSFELVESIFLDKTEDIVLWNIDQIKDLGIDIEIDDFGTGYASIVSLLKLKPKRLKIDRQLVMPIVTSASQRHLVTSIIDIGRSLGIKVVGEGVETMEHARILREIGCDVLQGFALSKPLSGEELPDFLRAESWRVVPRRSRKKPEERV